MNAVYAKRCYYKRKLEVIELEHNVKALREQNEKLNVESQWLQGLLQQTQRVVATQYSLEKILHPLKKVMVLAWRFPN